MFLRKALLSLLLLTICGCFEPMQSTPLESEGSALEEKPIASIQEELNELIAAEEPQIVIGDSIHAPTYVGNEERYVKEIYPLEISGAHYMHKAYMDRLGEVNVNVFYVDFADDPAQKMSKSELNNIIFANSLNNQFSLQNFVKTNSEGKVSLVGQTYGKINLPDPGSKPCPTIRNEIFEAAKSFGFNPSTVPSGSINLFMVSNIPAKCGCGGGMGGLGTAWVPYFKPARLATSSFYENHSNKVLAHEMGHAFGLFHDSKMICKDSSGTVVPLSDNCTSITYGNEFSSMGSAIKDGLPGAYSAVAQAKLGWKTPKLITSNGLYTISPIDRAARAGADQILQIKRELPNLTNSPVSSSFYLTRRLDVQGGSNDGVVVELSQSHKLKQGYAPFLLNMGDTQDDSLLEEGKLFKDAQTGISLLVKKIYANGNVDVQVSFDTSKSNIAPSAPTNLVAQVVEGSVIKLNWQASTDSSGFQVHNYKVKINDQVFENVVCMKKGTSMYSTVVPSSANCDQVEFLIGRQSKVKTHQILVQARDILGNLSAPSNIVQIKLPDGPDQSPPLPVTNIQANVVSWDHPSCIFLSSAGTRNCLIVTWDEVPDDVGMGTYFLQIYKKEPNGSFVKISMTTWYQGASAILKHNFASGEVYKFDIRRRDAAGNWDFHTVPAVSGYHEYANTIKTF